MRRMGILCLLWVGCAQTAEGPPPAPEPPPAPAQPSPAALGVTVIGMARVKMNSPSIFAPGEPSADLVLLVVAGPGAARVQQRGETLGGHWMIDQWYASQIAYSPGRAVLAVRDSGADLAGKRLWFYVGGTVDSEGGATRAEMLSAQAKAHRRVEAGAQASVALGDGSKPVVEVEDRGGVLTPGELRSLAETLMAEKSLDDVGFR